MGDFNKGKNFRGGGGNNRFGGGRSGGGRDGNRGFGGGRDRERVEMHRTTCADCGNSCEVPFRPTGEKPVFCSDCFRNKGGDNSRSSDNRGDRDFGNKQPYRNDSNRGGENNKSQLEQISTKLDKILKILGPSIEEAGNTKSPLSSKFKKVPKKEIDTSALNTIITKAVKKKPATKKAVTKKTVTKKKVAKKTTKKKK